MYRFTHTAPLALMVYADPGEDRSGPPLSQGFLAVLIRTVAAEYCDDPTLAALEQMQPELWYHGQNLETVLNRFEEQDPALPAEIGKTIYYTLHTELKALGMQTPSDVIATLPQMWQHVTRGDSGGWRVRSLAPGQAIIEASQPYNCRFEEGAVQGALEGFDATNVVIDHSACMRRGADCCVFAITWQTAVEDHG